MSTRNQNWYNLQSTRRYPLDEAGISVDDSGNFIADDILVDCHIKFPKTLGQCVYVQGITVSAGLVTVIFGVSGGLNDPTGHTVAYVSLPKPVTPYVNYAITSLVPGIAGWVAFGPGILNNFSGRYTRPLQSMLQARCARPYTPLPIPTIGKFSVGTSLVGVVNIAASTPVSATYETLEIDGSPRRAIVFRLDSQQITTVYNPLTEFLGPCGQRPESGTCAKTPIETINGIEPDCAGNINITFPGFNALPFAGCGGIDVLADVGLATVCASNKPKKPQEFSDACCNPNSPVFNGVDEYCWPDPTTAIDLIVDETLAHPQYPCLTLPLCVDFSSCDESPYFEQRDGQFSIAKTMAPATCCDPGLTKLTNHNTYQSTGIGGLNISILRNCATDWAYGKTISAELKIGTTGATRNGGLLLNYVQAVVNNRLVTTYIVVLLDVSHAKLRVLRYNGSSFVEEFTSNFNAQPNTWYRMSATPSLNGNAISLNFAVAELSGANPITGTAQISSVTTPTGLSGLFTNQSATFFNKFTVQ